MVEASIDMPTLRQQLVAAREATSDDTYDVVFVVPTGVPAVEAELSAASGVRVARTNGLPGRSNTQQIGAEVAEADTVVYLGPMVLPQPGFLAPLVDAVASGAACAAASIDGYGGYAIAPDTSVQSPDGDAPIEAVALDCLAARREFWLDLPGPLRMREGPPELQFGRWARQRGPLVVRDESTLSRHASGPISVIICTRDRADDIRELVARFRAFGANRDGGEIIVVDNGSSDGTAELCAELTAQDSAVKYVYEPEPGLSIARNSGAAVATTGRIAYIDDDARPAPGWHQAIAWGLTRGGVAATGGPIAALWPPERSLDWPELGLESNFGVLDHGDAIRVLGPPVEDIWGGNWSATEEAMKAVGPFNPKLGYSPDQRITGEESSMTLRMTRAGAGAVLFNPWACVGHDVPVHKLSDDYIIEHKLRAGLAFHQVDFTGVVASGNQQALLDEIVGSLREVFVCVRLTGEMQLAEALQRVQNAPGSVTSRANAAWQLGRVAGGVLLLGEETLELEDLTLHMQQENLRGFIN